MTSSIEEHFSQLEAPRVERNQLHGCVDIPILVICVENRLHWRLDVVFREDASRIRKRECTSHHDGNSAPVHEST